MRDVLLSCEIVSCKKKCKQFNDDGREVKIIERFQKMINGFNYLRLLVLEQYF